jgi:type I restriction enzyme S subunit
MVHRILPALFLDMFGDPASNPKVWASRSIGSLATKMSDGPFGSNLKSDHYTPEGIRVFRLQNVGVGYLNDSDEAFISMDHFRSLSNHECRPDDVIVGTLGEPNLRAFVHPPEIPRALNKADCVQIRVNPEVATPEWTAWLLNMPGTLSIANKLVTGQSRTRISMGRLRNLEVTPMLSCATWIAFVDPTFVHHDQGTGTLLAGFLESPPRVLWSSWSSSTRGT